MTTETTQHEENTYPWYYITTTLGCIATEIVGHTFFQKKPNFLELLFFCEAGLVVPYMYYHNKESNLTGETGTSYQPE